MRENPLVIVWLDNLGAFHPLVAELGLSNIAAAFEGGTTVPHLIGPVPSVTEAAIAEKPQTSFVVCNREEGGIAILSSEGEATLSPVDEGVTYRLAWGKDPLGLDEIQGQVFSAHEMLMRTHDKSFPYPVQWLELMHAPCCGDVMIVVDRYAFFWDMEWIVTTHGGPAGDEVGISLMAVGPEDAEAGILYGQQIASGSLRYLCNSLCRLLLGRPLTSLRLEADLLFGAGPGHSQ